MAEKRNPAADLRDKSDAELVRDLDDAYKALFNLRMRHATRQLENHQAIRRERRRIARLKTIQTERKLGIRRG
ncbi:MAG: 50S ribosomal protein L29 [Dehalococcoidia bacterium]